MTFYKWQNLNDIATELSIMPLTKEFALLKQHFKITTKTTNESLSELFSRKSTLIIKTFVYRENILIISLSYKASCVF